MPYIQLTRGKKTQIDSEVFETLNRYNWYANHIGHMWYAVCNIRIAGQPVTLYMHREILGLQKGDPRQVDHRNGNSLDNRQKNLRLCTKSSNGTNRGRPRNNHTSKFKGVYWHKRGRKWVAQIVKNGVHHYLGFFTSEITAARAYNDAAVKYHGEFACLNRI